ncbi:hypothetical protein L208DRAFT_1270210 [Tricholoma matsutake]|nr:hypothetical protein L208DRAFT_1270210 [Tricholoma matsutake 945]
MPHRTERQLATDTLLRGFLVQLITEVEADLGNNSDSELDMNGGEGDDDSDDLFDNDLPLSHAVLKALAGIHVKQYNEERREIKKSGEQLYLVLHEWKYSEPLIFHVYLWVTPGCFNKLIEALHHHPVFQNRSSNMQMPIEEQLAIALYHFGHYGNAASMIKVALWAGVGCGTVCLVTHRIMQACCDESFNQ